MRSLQEDGFTFDYGGSHIVFSKDKEALNFILSIMGENKTKIKRNTKILYKLNYVKYPFENGLSDLPKKDNFECISKFIINFLMREGRLIAAPSNLKEWCYYAFGQGIADRYLIPYNEKIWKHPLDHIGLDWVDRIPFPPLEDMIKSSLGIDTEGYKHQLHFYYPKYGGIQSIIKSLEKKINGDIIVDFQVKSIRKIDDKWLVSDGKRQKQYDRIISTIPVHGLIEALNAPERISNAADRLKFNSIITVMIGLDAPKINDISWLYIPERSCITHRISFPSNFSQFVVPENKSSLLAEITCNIGDEIWQMSDESIINRVKKELVKLEIFDESDICYLNLRRLRYAYVINSIDYGADLEILKDYLSRMGIDLLGRFAEFDYINMDQCILRVIEFFKDEF